MINFVVGNIIESKAEALVNTVNTVGVMGKGIALQFRNEFPNNYKIYKEACNNNLVQIGKLLVTEEDTLHYGKKIIINFPTKTNWRLPSEYSYIELGLKELVKVINEKSIKSIAIPPLGAGNGGLDWNKVKIMMLDYLLPVDCDIQIYEPNFKVQEVLKKERVKLTPPRAMLLSVLYDMIKNGEFVSEFTAEKTAYFLQRNGAAEDFKLNFQQNFYGPYSGKVKHVLYYLNGSYIMGYSSKDKKPFEELQMVVEAEKEVNRFLNLPENREYKKIADNTKAMLKGFYSTFGLELLSTVDFVIEKTGDPSYENITQYLKKWSKRKETMFAKEKFVQIAINHLRQTSNLYI